MREEPLNAASKFVKMRAVVRVIAVVVLSLALRLHAQDAYSMSPGIFTVPLIKSPFPGSAPLVPPIGTSLSRIEEPDSAMAVQRVHPDVLGVGSIPNENLEFRRLYQFTNSVRANLNQTGRLLESTAHPLSGQTIESTQIARGLMAARARARPSLNLTGGARPFIGTPPQITKSTEQFAFSLDSMEQQLSARYTALRASYAPTTESSRYSKLDALSPEVLGGQHVVTEVEISPLGLNHLPNLKPPQPALKTSLTADFTFKALEVTPMGGLHARHRRGTDQWPAGNGAGPVLSGSRLSTGLIALPSASAAIPKIPLPGLKLAGED